MRGVASIWLTPLEGRVKLSGCSPETEEVGNSDTGTHSLNRALHMTAREVLELSESSPLQMVYLTALYPLSARELSMRAVFKRSAATVALLASFALIGACVTSPPKSPEQVHADESTADLIYAVLNADPTYYFRHVDVRVDGGVVQLSGYIWSTEALYRAKQIAAKVPGVKGVVNDMELERRGGRRGWRP